MTFEEMTFSEKVDHIWEYYKLHIIGTLAGLLLIGSLLNIYLFNPAPAIVMDLTVRIPQYSYNSDYGLELRDDLVEALELPPSQTVMVELLQTDTGADPQMVMAIEAKFMGKAEIQEMDLILVDEAMFRYMLSEGYFMDIGMIEESFGISLPEEMKIYSTDPATQEQRFMSMDARALPKLAPLINDEENNYYVTVFVRSVQEERALKTLKYLSE